LVQGGAAASSNSGSPAAAASGMFGASKGKRLWKNGALKAARQGFSKRAEINSKDPRALRGAGMTAYKAENWDEARRYLQQVTDLTDEEWKAAGNGNGKADMIDAKLLRALALSHLNVASRAAKAEMCDHAANRKIFEASQRAFAPALRHMENAADPSLLLSAGRCYEGLTDWQGALTIYGSIIAGFPRYEAMTAVVVRAVALLAQLGQLPSAVQYCERILDLPPKGFTQDDMTFILARTYELANRKREAFDTYKEVHRLYNRRQMMLSQQKHETSRLGKEAGDDQLSFRLGAAIRQRDQSTADEVEREGPAPVCSDYGSFRAWKSWYESSETWRRRSQRLSLELELPIFGADAIVEVLRREQLKGGASAETWLSLARIKERLNDPVVSLQAAVKALEIQPYNHHVRSYVAVKDPSWEERFRIQEKRATDIQRVCYRGWKGRWLSFRRKNEAALMYKSATYVQKVRRGQMGRREFALRKRQVHSSTLIQANFRRRLAKKRVADLKAQHAAARIVQRKVRNMIRCRTDATSIQKIWRGVLGVRRSELQRRRIRGAMKMQSCWRSYTWRRIAEAIRRARDSAMNIQRIYRGHLARTYFRYIHSRFVGARGVQRITRGWHVRRRIRALKGVSAMQIQRLLRGHFGRIRVAALRAAPRRYLVQTPVVQLMRAASVSPDCAWLSGKVFQDIHYLNDAFASDVVVSESAVLRPKDAKRIGAMLYKNSMVHTLILSSGNMGDDGAVSIASALLFNTSLRTLAIGPNEIGEAGAVALARTFLNHNYSLRHLCVDHNPLGPVGARSLLSAAGDFFCRNYGQLQRLTLSDVGIDDSCAAAIGDLLYMNRRLVYLDVRGNKIADKGVEQIATALQNNSTLVGIDLRGNMIRSAGAALLAEALSGENNTHLQILRLDCNIILDDGALRLYESFRNSASLRMISVEGNPIGSIVQDKLNVVAEERAEHAAMLDSISFVARSKATEHSRVNGVGLDLMLNAPKELPKLRLSPSKKRNFSVEKKPYVPTHLWDSTPMPHEPRGRAAFDARAPSVASPLTLESIIPPELRNTYISLDGDQTLSVHAPLLPLVTAPVTYPSPSVPERLFGRRRSKRLKLRPRHTAKPRPNVFLAMVSPPAMHVNHVNPIDQELLEAKPHHLISRVQKSQGRNIYGGATW
jgi:tetratricopeptide (TPR) repeat protein